MLAEGAALHFIRARDATCSTPRDMVAACPPRLQSADHAGRAASRRQRGARRPAPAPEPLGHEPRARACAKPPAIPCWCAPAAAWCPRRARCARRSASWCATPKRCCVRPSCPTWRGWSACSRCAPRTVSSKPSARACWPGWPRKRRMRGCASCPRRTSSAIRCATARSTWTSAWSATPPARSCTRARCSATAMSAWCAPGMLARGKVSAARYASGAHVMATRRGLERGPVDEALAAQGLSRRIAAYVGGYAEALALARDSDLIATVPEKFCAALLADMRRFSLPLELPAFTVSMLWHPRMDADPAHRWLRACLHQICTAREGRCAGRPACATYCARSRPPPAPARAPSGPRRPDPCARSESSRPDCPPARRRQATEWARPRRPAPARSARG